MTDLVFEDLTPEELAVITDGAGCGNVEADVPDWIFRPACLRHDFCYWVGGVEADRAAGDLAFYRGMRALVKINASWYSRWWYYSMAWVYYRSVRNFSGKYFYYGEPRGRKELNEGLEKQKE